MKAVIQQIIVKYMPLDGSMTRREQVIIIILASLISLALAWIMIWVVM